VGTVPRLALALAFVVAGLLVLDAASGRLLGAVPLPALATVQHVGRAA
jgi:hypothetical protein